MGLCKIIVVDDEYLLRQGILHMLDWGKYGFSIVGEAMNSIQALELIEKEQPHIILCDIVMPNIDGIELSKIVKKRYPEIEIVILSGYDNFDYVKTAFKHGVADYVLKPTLTAKQLLNILLPLQKKFVQTVKFIDSKEDVKKKLLTMLDSKQMDEQLIKNQFREQEFTLIGYKHYNQVFIDIKTTNEKINKTFNQYFIMYIGEWENVHMFILNHCCEDRIEINRKWDELTRYIEANIIDVFLMKIYRIKSAKSLAKAYDEMKNLSKYYFYGYKYKYIRISLEQIKEKHIHNLDNKKFIQKASSKEPITALEFLEQYLSELTCDNGVMSNELKAIVQNAIYNFINIINIKEENLEKVNTNKILFFNNISNANTLEHVKKYYYEIIIYIKEELLHNSCSYSKMMKQIVSYIDNNYKEQINLQQIANEFHISYSYLSAYFNTHHNEGFNDYLNSVRIAKAKEFLVDQTIQISYVSELVGYSSPGYFTKVFKKTLGITPSNYRRMYMK
jgi:two-component system response regulator YesN